MENTPDLGSLISTLSNNPALLGMISELMKSSQAPRQSSPPPPPLPIAPPADASGNGGYSRNQGETPFGNLSPELISTLMGILSQPQKSSDDPRNGTADQPISHSGSSDNMLSRLLGGKAESENRIRLLNALRPYLGEERREKLDLILKLLKLAELGHLSGLLKSV